MTGNLESLHVVENTPKHCPITAEVASSILFARAIPALPVPDTLKSGQDLVDETVSREGLWRAQTPQAFRFGKLKAAYNVVGAFKNEVRALINSKRLTLALGQPLLDAADSLLQSLQIGGGF